MLILCWQIVANGQIGGRDCEWADCVVREEGKSMALNGSEEESLEQRHGSRGKRRQQRQEQERDPSPPPPPRGLVTCVSMASSRRNEGGGSSGGGGSRSDAHSAARLTSPQEQARMWVEEILPAFDTHIRKKWVHTLWRAGIPTHLRRLVWPLAIGNRLEACALTRRTFFFF